MQSSRLYLITLGALTLGTVRDSSVEPPPRPSGATPATEQ